MKNLPRQRNITNLTNTFSILISSFVVVPAKLSLERTLEVSAGSDLTIICEATGNSPPKITWRKHPDER